MVSLPTTELKKKSLNYCREGINALDAATIAYSNVSALRQQMKPDCRVHGIIHGKNWHPNGLFFFGP